MFEMRFFNRGSVLHESNLWTKCLCLLVAVPLAAFAASPLILIIVSVYVLALVRLSRIKTTVLRSQAGMYYVLLPFAAIVLSLIFSPGTLFARLLSGAELAIRFLAMVTAAVLFSNVTDPIEIPLALVRAKIPHKYGITVMVAMRMMPLIAHKVLSIVEAQRARGARLRFSFRGPSGLPSLILSVVVPAIYSTLELSVALSDTLLARGYNPDRPITVPPSRLGRQDFELTIAAVALLATVLWSR